MYVVGTRDVSCMKFAIAVNNLHKSYDKLQALKGLSFEIRNGEIYGLLGPNGAGKTTTIKILMGLLKPDEGSVQVLGISPQEDPISVKRIVGYVPEDISLFESLTPNEFFEFIASIRKIDAFEAIRRTSALMEALDAAQYANKPIATLSHGNRQKIAIISALLHDPKVLILDEPFSGMDALSIKLMQESIKAFAKSGKTVLFSTHIMKMAESLCTRIGIINEGIMVAEGTMDELKHKSEEKDLESVFLKLTEQEGDVSERLDIIRGAFS